MSDIDASTTAVIGSGRVEYSLDESAMPIEDLIAILEEAKEEGATHVVQASGNYRGAQWVALGHDWSWADNE